MNKPFGYFSPKKQPEGQKVVMQSMYRFVPQIFGCILLLAAGALPAQPAVLAFQLDGSEQSVFWENIRAFKPRPLENEGLTASFPLDSTLKPPVLYTQILDFFRQKSFLLVSIDSSVAAENAPTYPMLTLGPALRWVSLGVGTGFEGENWLETLRFKEKNFADKPLRYEAILKLEQSILETAENNGYPFAVVWLDQIVMDSSGKISAVLNLDRKRYFTFKTLKINGDVKLPKAYFPNYLGIKPGMPYSRTRVLRLREQLRSLLFVESTANPSVTFAGGGESGPNTTSPGQANPPGEATINLFLQKKRASRFDFILGILPQPNATDGKLLLTGSLNAAFQNALNLGERFSAELERLRPETQKVDIQASVPYLLGTTFGAEARLGIFRRDSTWTDAQSDVGVSYLFFGSNYVRFFWENKASTLQKVDTAAILASRKLPQNLDFEQNGFGLEASFARLDYPFNPRRGWTINVKAVAGFNGVKRNTQIENLSDASDPSYSFSSLYDSIVGRSARYRAELRGAVFIPIFVRSTIRIALRSGAIFSNKTIFFNENYRLGGNKLLRGFDEESLFATKFAVGTAEWRLLIGPNSYLSAFTDWGYLENLANKNQIILRPLGLGAGLNFETKAGIFGISAAVGRRDVGQGVDFRATKFHLGYVSLF